MHSRAKVFEVAQWVLEQDDLLRARGRAYDVISIGDRLCSYDDEGREIAASVVNIVTYTRSVEVLPAVYTGELVLKLETRVASGLPDAGWLWRKGPATTTAASPFRRSPE